MIGKKGQAGVEYMLVIAFILLVAGILSAYSYTTLAENVKYDKVSKAAKKIGDSIDGVNSFGEGNTVFASFELPNGVISASAMGSTVSFTVSTSAGNSDFVAYTNARITPVTLPSAEGQHEVKIEIIDGNAQLIVVS
ncbi:MAG: hypothetical protein V1494_01015 [Candidatus Diapherotrites archaeon]